MNKDVRELKTKEKFSVVVMFTVLPYLEDTKKLFKKLKEITEKDARIFMSVTGDDLTTFSETKLGAMALPPDTLGRWNKKNFEFIAKKFGFKIIEYMRKAYPPLSLVKNTAFGMFTSKSKNQDSFSNKVHSIKNKTTRRVLSGLVVGSYFVPAMFSLPKKRLYQVQLVHLKKKFKY